MMAKSCYDMILQILMHGCQDVYYIEKGSDDATCPQRTVLTGVYNSDRQ